MLSMLVVVGGVALAERQTSHQTSVSTGPETDTALRSSALPSTVPTTKTTTALAPLLPAGQDASRSTIPWSQIGPGWLLAVSDRGLYVVNPIGGRYMIESWPTGQPAVGALADWSGDSRRALFTAEGQDTTTIIEVDLATATSHSFTVAGYAQPVFTRPNGLAITISAVPLATSYLERVDLNGHKDLTFPAELPGAGRVMGGVLYTADGTDLVVGMTGGLGVFHNDGTTVRALPMAGNGCQPLRWWTTGVVLASCGDLWLVPISGAAPTDLTRGVSSANLGAWQLPGGVYLMQGACGSTWLAHLGGNGTTSMVKVPGTDPQGDVWVVGAYGAQLALRVTMSCDVPPPANSTTAPQSLVWFNPATNAVTVLLGPPLSADAVDSALLRDI